MVVIYFPLRTKRNIEITYNIHNTTMPFGAETWVEKHRPKTVDDIVGNKKIVETFKNYVKIENFPNLLFVGPAGTGKTSSAIVLARTLLGENWKMNFLELNSSDERGISVVRDRIKEFSRMAPFGSKFKITFLDECDALTTDAQNALRRIMEQYSRTTRFILSCNSSSKIIQPILSRCDVFTFSKIDDGSLFELIEKIAKKEELTLDIEASDTIISCAEGDARKAINILQSSAAKTKHITQKDIRYIPAERFSLQVGRIIDSTLEGKYDDARKQTRVFLKEMDVSAEKFVEEVHRYSYSMKSQRDKIELAKIVGDTDFRLVHGAHDLIQVDAMLARIASIRETK